MQMKIKYFKIRKAVAIIFAIAIAVCCAHHSSFQSVAATAMKNTAVQNTVQMPQVYPCGFPVGIYMETEGVMVVTTAQIPTNMETLSSPCEGNLQQGDYITSINGNPVNSKEELVSSVKHARDSRSLFILFANRNRLIFLYFLFRIQAERIVLVYGSKMMCRELVY